MDKLYVIKIGGNIIDDETKLSTFLKRFASVEGKKILVHGGGKLATKLAERLHIPQQMIDGRRITDAETLKIVTMVYAGLINKNIVARLQAFSCYAIGLTGADGNAILAHKRGTEKLDYGFAGDVDEVSATLLNDFLKNGLSPVFAPITHNGDGQLLNTNADTIAKEIAKSLASYYQVELIYSFEKAGVLMDANDEGSVIPTITQQYFAELKEQNVIFAGMIPKLENAFQALNNGVKKVVIGPAENLQALIDGTAGTSLINE